MTAFSNRKLISFSNLTTSGLDTFRTLAARYANTLVLRRLPQLSCVHLSVGGKRSDILKNLTTMGLIVHSLEGIPNDHHRDYFIYLLDYGWDEPLSEALRKNFGKMATLASEQKNAVVVMQTDPGVHFSDEVLSWHSINGNDVDSEQLLQEWALVSINLFITCVVTNNASYQKTFAKMGRRTKAQFQFFNLS